MRVYAHCSVPRAGCGAGARSARSRSPPTRYCSTHCPTHPLTFDAHYSQGQAGIRPSFRPCFCPTLPHYSLISRIISGMNWFVSRRSQDSVQTIRRDCLVQYCVYTHRRVANKSVAVCCAEAQPPVSVCHQGYRRGPRADDRLLRFTPGALASGRREMPGGVGSWRATCFGPVGQSKNRTYKLLRPDDLIGPRSTRSRCGRCRQITSHATTHCAICYPVASTLCRHRD
jgi:hypothetical protein